jgi:hypothetical protein
LWLAAALGIFLLMPRLQFNAGLLGLREPYTAEVLGQVVAGFNNFPLLFVVLPLIDAAALFALHRVFASRVVRIAWSVVVAAVILFLLLWMSAAHAMTLDKVRQALTRPAPLAPVVPPPPQQ